MPAVEIIIIIPGGDHQLLSSSASSSSSRHKGQCRAPANYHHPPPHDIINISIPSLIWDTGIPIFFGHRHFAAQIWVSTLWIPSNTFSNNSFDLLEFKTYSIQFFDERNNFQFFIDKSFC